MAELKTKPTDVSPASYIAAQPDATRREDCKALAAMMQRVTGAKPKMWGPSIVGFGQYHYRYESGREGDTCLVGFASRKPELVVYAMGGIDEKRLARLGKHRMGKGCLYVKKLADVDVQVLEEIVAASIAELKQRHPG